MSTTSPADPNRPGLRARKRLKTVRAIQDAALDLFVEKGYDATTVDEISERAEVSRATFFRLFASKAEVIGEGYGDDELRQAILERPLDEDDLRAALAGVREGWVPELDPDRVARQTRAASTSPVLRGLAYDTVLRSQGTISSALAQRRGLSEPDHQSELVAGVVFVAFSDAVNRWVYGKTKGTFAAAVDEAFATLDAVVVNYGSHST